MTTATISANTGATYSGSDDCQIKESTPTFAYGGGGYPDMEVSAYGVADWCNSVIAFPALSSISGPVMVTSATLRIYQIADDGGASTHTLSAFRALRPWTEAGATWNTYNGTNAWGTAGAKASSDRSTTTSATASSPASSTGYVDFTGAQLAADIQAFINGSQSNYGWVLARTDGANDSTWRQFATSLGSDGQRPVLSITYGPAAPTITAQPTQQSAAVGDTVTFSVTASSANGSISYQWYQAPPTAVLSNTPGTWSAISGATGSSYTTSALTSGDNGAWFYCVLTDSAGSVNTAQVRLFLLGTGSTGMGATGARSFTGWANKRRGRGQSHDMLRKATVANDTSAAATSWSDWLGLSTGPSALTGTSFSTLASNTSSASGAVSVTGSSAAAQQGASGAATGVAAVTGTSADNLGPLTTSGAGGVVAFGSAASSQADGTASGSGAIAAAGTAAVDQGQTQAAASGVVVVSASGADQQGSNSSSVAGSTTVVGSGASTLALVVVGAQGSVVAGGLAAAPMTGDVGVASGAAVVTGSLALQQAGAVGQAEGEVQAVLGEGRGAAVLAGTTATTTGQVLAEGSASGVQQPVDSSAQGTVALSGSQSTTLSAQVSNSQGVVVTQGSADMVQQPATASSIGGVAVSGQAAASQQPCTSSAHGSAQTDAAEFVPGNDIAVYPGARRSFVVIQDRPQHTVMIGRRRMVIVNKR